MPDKESKLEVVHEVDSSSSNPQTVLGGNIAKAVEKILVEQFSDDIAMCEIAATRMGPVNFVTVKFVSKEAYDKLYEDMKRVLEHEPPFPPTVGSPN